MRHALFLLAFCLLVATPAYADDHILIIRAGDDNHLFQAMGEDSESAARCLVDISAVLAEELGIEQFRAEAVVNHALTLEEIDWGAYTGHEFYKGEINYPAPDLNVFLKRKVFSVSYDCKEQMKTDGTWRWHWNLSIIYKT